jgi:DNA polymerase-3 subunit gamma/tau
MYHNDKPGDLAEIVGNRATLEMLENVLNKSPEWIPHSYLVKGRPGCGKTMAARGIARRLGCDMEFDFREIDSADFRGVDHIREVRRNMYFRPMGEGPCRVWLFDECHMLTKPAQNALLKALEEPPIHAYFLLATTEHDQLLPTLTSRCMQFEMERLGEEDMATLLTAKSEG